MLDRSQKGAFFWRVLQVSLILMFLSASDISAGAWCRVSYFSDHTVSTCISAADIEDQTTRYDCRRPPCDFCGNCHTGEDDQKKYDTGEYKIHEEKYFKNYEYRLSKDEKLIWGMKYYIQKVGDELRLSDMLDRHILTYPKGSKILRDVTGQPSVVLMTGEPRFISQETEE